MKLLLLLLGANTLVDGFTEVHGVKFRDVPGKRADRASWRVVHEQKGGVVVWHRPGEQLEFLGTPVTKIQFSEARRGAGIWTIVVRSDDCSALLKAVTAAWGAPDAPYRDERQLYDTEPDERRFWTGSSATAQLFEGDDCSLVILSNRWDPAKQVWKK